MQCDDGVDAPLLVRLSDDASGSPSPRDSLVHMADEEVARLRAAAAPARRRAPPRPGSSGGGPGAAQKLSPVAHGAGAARRPSSTPGRSLQPALGPGSPTVTVGGGRGFSTQRVAVPLDGVQGRIKPAFLRKGNARGVLPHAAKAKAPHGVARLGGPELCADMNKERQHHSA